MGFRRQGRIAVTVPAASLFQATGCQRLCPAQLQRQTAMQNAASPATGITLIKHPISTIYYHFYSMQKISAQSLPGMYAILDNDRADTCPISSRSPLKTEPMPRQDAGRYFSSAEGASSTPFNTKSKRTG